MVIAALWVLEGGSFTAGWLIAAMKIVAVGIVTQALLGMWYQLCVDRETKITALIAAITFFAFPIVLTQVALIGLALIIGFALKGTVKNDAFNFDRSKSKVTGIISFAIWIVLMSIAVFFESDSQWITLLTGNVLSGGLVFGGGHVVLPFLQAEFVPSIDITSFLAGYGVAQAVPGPLFSFAAFIGTILLPESLGLAALVAVIAIFLHPRPRRLEFSVGCVWLSPPRRRRYRSSVRSAVGPANFDADFGPNWLLVGADNRQETVAKLARSCSRSSFFYDEQVLAPAACQLHVPLLCCQVAHDLFTAGH